MQFACTSRTSRAVAKLIGRQCQPGAVAVAAVNLEWSTCPIIGSPSTAPAAGRRLHCFVHLSRPRPAGGCFNPVLLRTGSECVVPRVRHNPHAKRCLMDRPASLWTARAPYSRVPREQATQCPRRQATRNRHARLHRIRAFRCMASIGLPLYPWCQVDWHVSAQY